MKKIFAKLKSLFMILLIIPVMFVFGACKNNENKNNDSSNNPGIEQPGASDDPQGGDEPETPPIVSKKTFNLNVNYALPTYLEGLIDDEELTPEVDTGYTLPTFVGTDFEDYFSGWYTTEIYDEESKVDDITLTAEENENVSIYAKWNINDIENFFYTDGVHFEFEGNRAIPVSYNGESEIVIISKYYMNGETPCYVDSIGANCFKNNDDIKEFRTSMLDFSVGESAFEGSTLEKIDFSKVITVDEYAFKDTQVQTAVFSNKLAEISSNVFEGCTKLETVDFSKVNNNNVDSIPSRMFFNCVKLENIDLSIKMTKISSSAFENCSTLKNVNFLSDSAIEEIENRAFANCVSLDNIEIPDTVVSYGTAVFAGTNITNMTISNMFYNKLILDFSFSTRFGDLSSSLKSLTFKGDRITKIYANYLSGYSELETLVMNNQIIEIENKAFVGCSKLKNIIFSSALVGDNLNVSALSSTKWYADIENYLETESLHEMVINGTLICISNSVSGEYVIPENVTHIAADLFAKNQNVTTVEISKNVEYINKYAFYKSKVTSISVDSENDNYAVDKGELEKFSEGMIEVGVFVNYCSLYEINENGEEVTLISYVADIDGGLLIIPETVEVVYNSAFNSNCVPYFVYMSKPSSSVNLVTKFAVEEKGPFGGYLFADSSITTSSSNANVLICKYLSEDKYEVDFDNGTIIVDFDGLSGYYFARVEIENPMNPTEKLYSYYLVKTAEKQVVDLTTIYPEFAI